MNTSISEQVFSWFRGHATTLNTSLPSTHRFLVLVYAKRHNKLILDGQATYLNPHAAHKTMQKAGILHKPASHAYVCKKPAVKVMRTITKRPAARMSSR